MSVGLRPRLAAADASPRSVLTAAAAVAASAVALLSSGTWGVLAAVLALAAWDGWAAVVAVLAGVAVTVRIGTPSLAALAGSQGVLGPAAFVGPPAAAASAWVCALALVLVSPARLRAVPFGLAAALVLAGPSAATGRGLVVRLIGAAGCVELSLAADRLPPRFTAVRRPIAAVLAVVAAGVAVPGRPSGWRWTFDGHDAVRGVLLVVAVAAVVVATVLAARRRVVETMDA